MNRDPQSLAEAQKLAEAHEHNFKATLGRETETRAGRARHISWADEEESFTKDTYLLKIPKCDHLAQVSCLKPPVSAVEKQVTSSEIARGPFPELHLKLSRSQQTRRKIL